MAKYAPSISKKPNVIVINPSDPSFTGLLVMGTDFQSNTRVKITNVRDGSHDTHEVQNTKPSQLSETIIANEKDQIVDAIIAASEKIDPRDAEIWNKKGLGFVKKEQYEEALHCFETALKASPNFQKAWYNRGITIMKLEKSMLEAHACFQKAVEIVPTDAGAWFCKGTVLRKLGLPEDSLSCFERAVEIDPYHAGAWHGRALAAKQLGYSKQANEFLKRAKELGLK